VFGLVLLLIAKLGGGATVVGEDLDRDSYDEAPNPVALDPAAPEQEPPGDEDSPIAASEDSADSL
ncbi:MAG TPA: hypothetical protein VF349_07440, partial [Candidatus Limnocylindrales bacterium]